MTSRQYDAIDGRVVQEIKRLHKEHPKLGHDGLLDALGQQNVHVVPQELELLMKRNGITAERYWRPWKWAGLRGSWLAGIIHHRPARRWRLWRK